MLNSLKTVFLATALFLAITPARAEIEHYTIDKPHTEILFFADHLGFSHSMGKFVDYSGSFVFDTTSPAKSYVEVTVKTDSLEMNDEKWNTHLKSADFFDVKTYPTMTFKSTSIVVKGEKTADITGDLTLHGVTKSVVLKAIYNKSGKHAFSGKYVAGFSATTHIKRSDFGVKYGLPIIGDDVDIRLEVEGIKDEAPAAAPAITKAK